jgi:hypothetical protein
MQLHFRNQLTAKGPTCRSRVAKSLSKLALDFILRRQVQLLEELRGHGNATGSADSIKHIVGFVVGNLLDRFLLSNARVRHLVVQLDVENQRSYSGARVIKE